MIIWIIVTSSSMCGKLLFISKLLPTQGAWITLQFRTKATLQWTNLIEWSVELVILYDKKELSLHLEKVSDVQSILSNKAVSKFMVAVLLENIPYGTKFWWQKILSQLMHMQMHVHTSIKDFLAT